MRYIIMLALLLIGCNAKNQKYPIGVDTTNMAHGEHLVDQSNFHIKVAYFGFCNWCIRYTNDNYSRYERIGELSSSENYRPGTMIFLRQSQKEAIEYASQFKSYEQCVNWNDSLEKRAGILQQQYDENHKKDTHTSLSDACDNSIGKEIIIK